MKSMKYGNPCKAGKGSKKMDYAKPPTMAKAGPKSTDSMGRAKKGTLYGVH